MVSCQGGLVIPCAICPVFGFVILPTCQVIVFPLLSLVGIAIPTTELAGGWTYDHTITLLIGCPFSTAALKTLKRASLLGSALLISTVFLAVSMDSDNAALE
jgi:hypothetical protein